jgi:hypothetical protein
MKSISLSLSTAAFAAFAMACSSDDQTTTPDDMGTTTSTVPTPGPTTGDPISGCNPSDPSTCIAPGKAEPCAGFNSGWPGDEYCIEEPDPSMGYQLHVGPTDYDNPDDYARYVIVPGQETSWATGVVTPNTTTVFTDEYFSRMRPGSHHMIIFGRPVGTQLTEGDPQSGGGTGAGAADGALDGDFLAGATRSIQNVSQFSDDPADQGIAGETPPNRPLSINLHFINATEVNQLQELWVNFITIPEDQVTKITKAVTWYGGLGMNIAPGTHTTLTSEGNQCSPPEPIRILGVTGHVHASTLRITASMQRVGEQRQILFEDYDWHEPEEWRFNNSVDNPLPDGAGPAGGGLSGILNTSPGDQFQWECEIQNQTTSFLTFSNRVYDGEMCNVFGFYAVDRFPENPARRSWLCAFF